MFERFSNQARRVMGLAREEAVRLNSEFIGTEHILIGILQEGGDPAALLNGLQVDLKRFRGQFDKLATPATGSRLTLDQVPFSPRAKRSIELAAKEADHMGQNIMGSGHLLLGILGELDCYARDVLENQGVDLVEMRTQVLQMLGVAANRS